MVCLLSIKRDFKRKYPSLKTKQTSVDIYGTRPGTRVSEETLIFDHKSRQTLSSRVNSTVGYLKNKKIGLKTHFTIFFWRANNRRKGSALEKFVTRRGTQSLRLILARGSMSCTRRCRHVFLVDKVDYPLTDKIIIFKCLVSKRWALKLSNK